MEKLLFVFTEDELELSLCDTLSKLEGVETVFEVDGFGPDYIIFCKPLMAEKVMDDLRVTMFVSHVEEINVVARQDHVRRIIDVDDIPGGPVQRPAQLKVAQPVITSSDIPGPKPAMRASARVHRDISSQAGLASFMGGPCDTEAAGLQNFASNPGFGSCLGTLGEMLS